ncbi:hypothetical protein O5282_18025 [Escherichia coli]|nr:hypothetical protein [Escherichia coli]
MNRAATRPSESIQALCYPGKQYKTCRSMVHIQKSPVSQAGEWQWVLPAGAVVSRQAPYFGLPTSYARILIVYGYTGDFHDPADGRGSERHSPNFKPDWNETLLHRAKNYISCGVVCGVKQGAGNSVPFDAAACHQWWLQLAKMCEPEQIVHIPSLT